MEISSICVIFFYIYTLLIGVLGAPPEKIIGGEFSLKDEFPYQVSIRLYGQHFCGGSIISTTHILTAGHCLIDKMHLYQQLVVVSGTTNVFFGGTSSYVKSVKIHPSFLNTAKYMFANDIAVITLSSPIVMTKAHHIIKLASRSDYGGMEGIVSGWGDIYPGANKANPYLSKLPTNVINATWCQNYLGKQLYNSQVCAKASNTKGTCQGDSGGPLAVGDEIVGIVSFGYSCGVGYPDIYTSVYSYKKFIKEAIKESGLSDKVLYPPYNKIDSNIKVNRVVNKISNYSLIPAEQYNNKNYYIFSNGFWYLVKFN